MYIISNNIYLRILWMLYRFGIVINGQERSKKLWYACIWFVDIDFIWWTIFRLLSHCDESNNDFIHIYICVYCDPCGAEQNQQQIVDARISCIDLLKTFWTWNYNSGFDFIILYSLLRAFFPSSHGEKVTQSIWMSAKIFKEGKKLFLAQE